MLISQADRWVSIITLTSAGLAFWVNRLANARNNERPRSFRSDRYPKEQGAEMAKGQQRGNKEARKPKKVVPKSNVSKPSTKGVLPSLVKD